MHTCYYGISAEQTIKLFRKKKCILFFSMILATLMCATFLTLFEKHNLLNFILTIIVYFVVLILVYKKNKKIVRELFCILELDCDPIKLYKQLDCLRIVGKRAKINLLFWKARIGKFADEHMEEGYEALKKIKSMNGLNAIYLLALEASYAYRRNDVEEYFRIADELFNMQKPNGKQLQLYNQACETVKIQCLFFKGQYEESLKLCMSKYKGKADTSLNNVSVVRHIADCKWHLGKKADAVEYYQFVADCGGTTYMVKYAQGMLDTYYSK